MLIICMVRKRWYDTNSDIVPIVQRWSSIQVRQRSNKTVHLSIGTGNPVQHPSSPHDENIPACYTRQTHQTRLGTSAGLAVL